MRANRTQPRWRTHPIAWLLAIALLAVSCAPTLTPTPTPRPTREARPSPRPSPRRTRPIAATAPPTASPSPTATSSPTAPPMPTTTPTPSTTPSPTPSPSPTATPRPPTPSPTPCPPDRCGEDTIFLPTYPYARFLTPAADARLNGFPYMQFDRAAYEASAPRPAPQPYRRLILQNRYLRVTLLPDLGGRVYELVFLPSGNNVLYRNPVVKPTRWGPTDPPGANWWLAVGGIEWGFPVDEHGYEFGVPWAYRWDLAPNRVAVTLDDGHPTLPNVRVTVALPDDRAALTLHIRVANPTAAPARVTFWLNAMVAPGPGNTLSPGFRFIYPARTVAVHSTSDPDLPAPYEVFPWPEYRGRDFRYPRNWQGWLGFFVHPQAQANWAAVYDDLADEGLVRVFPGDVARGLKGFGFGNGIPPSEWTDDGSVYAEMHGGLAPTFRDWIEIPPGGIIQWSETWFPVWRIGGVVDASAQAAVNLTVVGEALRVRIFPVRPVEGSLDVTLGDVPLARLAVAGTPTTPIDVSVPLPPTRGQREPVAVRFTTAAGEVVLNTRQEMDVR